MLRLLLLLNNGFLATFFFFFFLAVGTQLNGALLPPTGMECGTEWLLGYL